MPTSTSFIVSWGAPSTGTPPFTYLTQYRVAQAPTFIDNPSGSTSTLSQGVINLNPSTTYDVRVKVTNLAGTNFSTIVQGTTQGIATVPSQVGNLTTSSIATTSITITWPLNTTGPTPTGYQPQYKTSVSGIWLNSNPPYTVSPESPEGTTITPGSGTITDGLGDVWAVSALGQVVHNTVVDPDTHDVVSGLMWAHNFYQVTNVPEYWTWTASAGWANLPDPRLAGPSPPVTTASRTISGLTSATAYNFRVYAFNAAGNGAVSNTANATTSTAQQSQAPVPAAAVGFNTLTFGPGLVVGSRGTAGVNWYSSTGTITQLPNSQLLFNGGGSSFNKEAVAAEEGAGLNGVGNRSFGGGGYFEALISLANGTNIVEGPGWPAWWSNCMEGQIDTSHANMSHWPGQGPGVGIWFEPDFMEFFNGNGSSYGGTVHNWTTNGLFNGNLPGMSISGADIGQPHYYGFRWVPATPTSQGSVGWYFDRVLKLGYSYNYFNLASPTGPDPGVSGTTIGGTGGNTPLTSMMDTTPDANGRHLQLILGTGSHNPMTVYSVEVWQTNANKNIFA